ncbi:PAS domain-containing sensor histidine kinase, partial [Pseudomonas aeruginosa]|nr:PAS domain-containing sensor histidine kinase [Pseudomonas aeruginosa]
MLEFSRSSSAEAERPEPFSQEGAALWSVSLRSWDLCFELDEQDRVIRVGGRQAYRLQCRHGHGEEPRPFAEYLERRAPRAPARGRRRPGGRGAPTRRPAAPAPVAGRVKPQRAVGGG